MFAIATIALATHLVIPVAALQSALAVSGVWAGSVVVTVDGRPTGEIEYVHVVLKQAGDAVTGTAGADADHQYPIRNGKVTAVGSVTTLSFEFIANGVHRSFSLRPVDGNLKGDVRIVGEDGHEYTATADLKPVREVTR